MSPAQDIKTDSLIKVITKGGIIIFIGSIIGKVLRFIFYIVLTRILGASLYGLYSIGQSIIDIVTNIGLLGDGRGLIRFAASFIYEKDTARLKGVIISYLVICFLLSSIISAALFCFAGEVSSRIFHNLALKGVLQIFAAGFPFYILSLTVIPIGYAFQKMEYKVIMQEISYPVISTIVITIIFILGGRLYGAVMGFVVSSISTVFLGFYLLKKIFPEISSKSEYIFEIKKLLTYSLPIIGVIFCYYLLFRLDRIMLGVYRQPYEVGIYSAASNTAMSMLAFTTFFESSFSPVITQLYHSNRKEELKKIFNCITFWGVSLALIPCLTLIIFNQEIISLFGKDFKAGGFVLVVLTISLLLEVIPGQLRQLFQMSAHQNIEFFNSFAMIIVNLFLNFMLIPIWGMKGAAVAVFLSVMIVSIIRTIELKRFFNFLPFTSRYIKFLIFVVSVITLTLVFVINGNILLRGLSMLFAISGFLLLVYKLKSEEDMVIWDSIKSKLFKPRSYT